MSFSGVEVREVNGRGRCVIATKHVAAGSEVLVDSSCVFAIDAEFANRRCALCACVCTEDSTGVACKLCEARAAASAPLKRWMKAVEKLGLASASVALVAAVLSSKLVKVSALETHERDFDAATATTFRVVSRGLSTLCGVDGEAAFRAICASAVNSHALLDHSEGSTFGLDSDPSE